MREGGGGAAGRPSRAGLRAGRSLAAQLALQERRRTRPPLVPRIQLSPRQVAGFKRAGIGVGEVATSTPRQLAAKYDRHLAKEQRRRILTPPQRVRPTGFDRFVGDLLDAAAYTPTGLYRFGRAYGLDARDQLLHAQGPNAIPAPRTRKLLRAVGSSTLGDLRHPLRHPGYTFLSALALASGGAGAASRLSVAGRTFAATGRAGVPARLRFQRPYVPLRRFNVDSARLQPVPATTLDQLLAAARAAGRHRVHRPPFLPLSLLMRYGAKYGQDEEEPR